MFFIFTTGRRSQSTTADDLDELGEVVTEAMNNMANDGITVAVGKTDQAVMPYVMIRRNPDTDEWEGELGDSIKLGLEEGLLIEKDPIQMFNLEEAIEAGIVTVEDDGPVRRVTIGVPDAKQCQSPQSSKSHKSKKLSSEEKVVKAKRMIDDLFTDLHKE